MNVTLDEVHAERLRRLAERTHVEEGALARSLPSLTESTDRTSALGPGSRMLAPVGRDLPTGSS
jgi:hypothetical protein